MVSQDLCQEGFLAEITSYEEEALLDTLLLEDIEYWIGLSDFASEGTWIWQNSHKHANYTNWAPSQPDAPECDCAFKSYKLHYGGQGWHNFDCTYDTWHDGIHALCEVNI